MFFPFYFPDQTGSLQRKSNLILNIFSMKAIKNINSLQKEWDNVGYSKRESHHGNCFLEILNSSGSRHDYVKKGGWVEEKQYRALSVVSTNAAEGLPWIIDCMHRREIWIRIIKLLSCKWVCQNTMELVPRCSSLLPVKILLSNQRATLRSKVWREVPGIRVTLRVTWATAKAESCRDS